MLLDPLFLFSLAFNNVFFSNSNLFEKCATAFL